MNKACKTLIEALSHNVAGDLTKIQFPEKKLSPTPSDYCQSRSKLYELLTKRSYTEAAFAQCLKDVENGCSECNQAMQYQSRHLCPLFQHKIAEFYRFGRFVPANAVIAHNWDLMASRQGYELSMRQVAEDLILGEGCTRDVERGAEQLAEFAERGDHDCARKVVELVENGDLDHRMAARYMLMLANSNDEDSVQWKSRVAGCFATGSMGFPIDVGQRERWELLAAEGGDADIIGVVARRYYDECKWQQALRWYNRLQEACVDEDYTETIDEIFDKCIQLEGLTPQLMAEKGRKLYLGLDCEEDQHSAFRYFSMAADTGNGMGLYWLGRCYTDGRCVAKDADQAEYYYRKAAKAGNIGAMVHVYDNANGQDFDISLFDIVDKIDEGMANNDIWTMFHKARLLFDGKILTQDKEASRTILRQLISINNDAFFIGRLGFAEYKLSNYELAYGYFMQAAKRGCIKSQHLVGVCYSLGKGISLNYFEAVKWFTRAAERGHKEAQMKLYHCYAKGQGVEKNMTLANQWCLKAAEQELPEAEYTIGENYYSGNGVIQNLKEARKWIILATEHGYKNAYFRGAYMLQEGEGGPKDFVKAFSLYTELAEAGNHVAMNNLACMYAEGEGINCDYDQAAHWLLKSAEAGDSVAQCNIGTYYRDGIGVEQDYEKAKFWFEKSSKNGYSHATFYLARLYRYGQGVENDLYRAVSYYEQAISMPHSNKWERRGYDESIIELADLYYNGIELAKDFVMAFELYKQAAEANIKEAFLKLGYCYEYGYGIQRNIETAVYWYRKAAAEGDASAKNRLDELGYDYVEPDNDDLPF